MAAASHGAPHPGPVFGAYPERADAQGRRQRAGRIAGSRALRLLDRPARGEPATPPAYHRVAAQAAALALRWRAEGRAALEAHALDAAGAIARDGFTARQVVPALACVAVHAWHALRIEFHPCQFVCAAALLDQRFAEMATGEGKTYAAALAAASAGLAGIPVHLITANEYLAERDAGQLAPLYDSLGLRASAALEGWTPEARRQAYRCHIVHATARTIAFDWLRDRLQRSPGKHAVDPRRLGTSGAGRDAGLVLRGLCMAIVDEADSVLIDEARMPLIISGARHDPGERARVWQALDLAQRLSPAHFRVHAEEHRAELNPAGRDEIERLAAEYGSAWLNRLHREELVQTALTALHALRRDVDYLVGEEGIEIIDATTGRRAPGRIWSRGLHAAVALKEGAKPPPATDTRSRTTYPALFGRYHHLCGLSGTLREVRGELRTSYGVAVVEVPRNRPSQRREGAMRLFATRAQMHDAACERSHELVKAGRPVLLATDSVADSMALSQQLARAGVPHRLLNAQTAAEEAAVVAAAGQHATVTVATQMAGRGTDIRVAEPALSAGGLHVLNLQHNRSRRVDRQIGGRAGRQGEVGSNEHWISLDAPLFEAWPATRWIARAIVGTAQPDGRGRDRLARWLVALAQRSAEQMDAAARRSTSRQDRDWSRRLHFAHNTE